MANLKYIGKNILNHTLEIKKGDVSGSSSSTGSFGRIEGTTLEASSFGSSTGTLISGSFTSTSSSLASRITTAESELGNTLISSSAQIASDISGSWRGALSGSLNIISGSSTSTGSFGNLRIAGNSAFGDLSFDTFLIEWEIVLKPITRVNIKLKSYKKVRLCILS